VPVYGVLDISLKNLSAGCAYFDGGVELRHKNRYRGMTLAVTHGKRSISLVHPLSRPLFSLDKILGPYGAIASHKRNSL